MTKRFEALHSAVHGGICVSSNTECDNVFFLLDWFEWLWRDINAHCNWICLHVTVSTRCNTESYLSVHLQYLRRYAIESGEKCMSQQSAADCNVVNWIIYVVQDNIQLTILAQHLAWNIEMQRRRWIEFKHSRQMTSAAYETRDYIHTDT